MSKRPKPVTRYGLKWGDGARSPQERPHAKEMGEPSTFRAGPRVLIQEP